MNFASDFTFFEKSFSWGWPIWTQRPRLLASNTSLYTTFRVKRLSQKTTELSIIFGSSAKVFQKECQNSPNVSRKTFCGKQLFHQFQILRELWIDFWQETRITLSSFQNCTQRVEREFDRKSLGFFRSLSRVWKLDSSFPEAIFLGKNIWWEKSFHFLLLSVSRRLFYGKKFIVFRDCKFIQYFRFLSRNWSSLCPKKNQESCQNCIYHRNVLRILSKFFEIFVQNFSLRLLNFSQKTVYLFIAFGFRVKLSVFRCCCFCKVVKIAFYLSIKTF